MRNLREEIEHVYEDAFPEVACKKFSSALTNGLFTTKTWASSVYPVLGL